MTAMATYGTGTSPDNGLTWSAEWQLTTDPSGDFDPAVFQAADGKMWVVWASYRTGNLDIWYKTAPMAVLLGRLICGFPRATWMIMRPPA